MSKFEIEKNVPIPDVIGSGYHSKYPFRQMVPGDSLFIPGSDGLKARTAAAQFSKRNSEYKFTTAKVDGGYRVWRIHNDSELAAAE